MGSQLGEILSPKGHLAMSGDLSVVTNVGAGGGGGVLPSFQWVEARDAAEHPTMHKAAPTHHLPPAAMTCLGPHVKSAAVGISCSNTKQK